MGNKVEVMTMKTLVERTGKHRVTLKRMEDRGIIPKAKWVEGVGRVYTEQDIRDIERIIIERDAARTNGKVVVDKDTVRIL